MKGRLNLFQATMLRWRDLYPYNAVHVVRIDVPLDHARLQRDLDAVLTARGLTGLTLDVARRRFEFTEGPPRSELRVSAGGQDPAAVVRDEIEREINTPFPRDGRLEPFRFFAVDAGASFHFGLAYDHFIAGGDSIVGLMKCIVDRHSDTAMAPGVPPDRYPATYARLFARHAGTTLRGLARLPAMAASCRRSMRPRYPGGIDPRNAFASFRVDRTGFGAITRSAKAWGITRNDLLMAILLQALSPLAGEARHTDRRRELSLASIVNVRRDFQPGIAATFGQFVSSFRVSHPVPTGIRLRQLAEDLHVESMRIKRGKLYLQTLLAMGVAGVVWRFLSPARRAGFHAKNYPVSAGITPLNVTALWKEAGGGVPPPEYLRAVSTGPLSPMVVAVTTTGEALYLGISFRTAAFTREDIARIGAAILLCLRNLEP